MQLKNKTTQHLHFKFQQCYRRRQTDGQTELQHKVGFKQVFVFIKI